LGLDGGLGSGLDGAAAALGNASLRLALPLAGGTILIARGALGAPGIPSQADALAAAPPAPIPSLFGLALIHGGCCTRGTDGGNNNGVSISSSSSLPIAPKSSGEYPEYLGDVLGVSGVSIGLLGGVSIYYI
jgi:hypothetical protein